MAPQSHPPLPGPAQVDQDASKLGIYRDMAPLIHFPSWLSETDCPVPGSSAQLRIIMISEQLHALM